MSEVVERDNLPAWPGYHQAPATRVEREQERVDRVDLMDVLRDMVEGWWDDDDPDVPYAALMDTAYGVIESMVAHDPDLMARAMEDEAVRAVVCLRGVMRVQALESAKRLNRYEQHHHGTVDGRTYTIKRGDTKYRMKAKVETTPAGKIYVIKITDPTGQVEEMKWNRLQVQVAATSRDEAVSLLAGKRSLLETRQIGGGPGRSPSALPAPAELKALPSPDGPPQAAAVDQGVSTTKPKKWRLAGERTTVQEDFVPARASWVKVSMVAGSLSAAVIARYLLWHPNWAIVMLVIGGFAGYKLGDLYLIRYSPEIKVKLRWTPWRAHLAIFGLGGLIAGALSNVVVYAFPFLMSWLLSFGGD